MTFDDELRERFRRADAAIQREPLDFGATVARAKRVRMAMLGGAVAAAATVAAIFVAVSDRTSADAPVPIPPAATPADETPLPPRVPAGDGHCSAADLFVTPDDPDLPENVRSMRAQIVYAAVACDYEQLEYLAGTTFGEPFQYSFGESGEPARYWRRLETEEPGEPVTAALVKVLEMRWKLERLQLDADPAEESLYVWPRAASADPSDADWEELIEAGLHDRGEVEQMRRSGLYYGYRVAIAPDGDWIYFVAGD